MLKYTGTAPRSSEDGGVIREGHRDLPMEGRMDSELGGGTIQWKTGSNK